MSKRGLTTAELEKLLYASSDSELDDNVEKEDFVDSDSDDSVCDPNYFPNESDPEEALETCLKKVWKPKKSMIQPPQQGISSHVSEEPIASTSHSQKVVVSCINFKKIVNI